MLAKRFLLKIRGGVEKPSEQNRIVPKKMGSFDLSSNFASKKTKLGLMRDSNPRTPAPGLEKSGLTCMPSGSYYV